MGTFRVIIKHAGSMLKSKIVPDIDLSETNNMVESARTETFENVEFTDSGWSVPDANGVIQRDLLSVLADGEEAAFLFRFTYRA